MVSFFFEILPIWVLNAYCRFYWFFLIIFCVAITFCIRRKTKSRKSSSMLAGTVITRCPFLLWGFVFFGFCFFSLKYFLWFVSWVSLVGEFPSDLSWARKMQEKFSFCLQEVPLWFPYIASSIKLKIVRWSYQFATDKTLKAAWIIFPSSPPITLFLSFDKLIEIVSFQKISSESFEHLDKLVPEKKRARGIRKPAILFTSILLSFIIYQIRRCLNLFQIRFRHSILVWLKFKVNSPCPPLFDKFLQIPLHWLCFLTLLYRRLLIITAFTEMRYTILFQKAPKSCKM